MWRRLGCLIFLICVAAPSHAEDDTIVQWRKEVSNRLVAAKRFPPEAQGQSGSARVRFVIDRSGRLVSSWLHESTGSAVLDAEALALVERAQPFPAPPPEADDDKLKLQLPVIFAKRQPPIINPAKEAEIREQDIAIRKENSEMNTKLRTLCRGC